MDAEQREAWRRAGEAFDRLLELEPALRDDALRAMALEPAVCEHVAALLAGHARTAGPLEADVAADLLRGVGNAGPPADLAGRRLGAYRLREEIGRGGMAVVFRAERDDGAFEQEVAVKVLGTGLLPTAAAERFRREQQLLARLRHRSIAAMLDGGVAEDGTPYLVMERIDGRPIDRYSVEEALSLRARLELFLEVCAAVAYAHQNLVVHRDIKPSNVLVSTRGEVKLLDFGIAKLLEPALAEEPTRTLARVLTPGYAAPEQAAGGPITTATDVYGLGRLLARLLEGVAGDADLENVLARALREEPERRYPDARSLAADLERWLAGRPVEATPDSLLYRLGKGVRRHRASIAAGALVVAVGAAGLAASLVQAARARREARNAAAINTFLTDLFRASDPDAAQGGDPRASELFARGAARARAELGAEPLLQADLLARIGRIQMERGWYDGAVESLGEALRLRAERLGEQDPRTASVRADLGLVRYHQGDVGEAIALLRTALAAHETAARPRDAERIRIELRLADMLAVAGDYAEARRRSAAALARLATAAPRDAELEARARQTLGIALHELDDLEAAAAQLGHAVEIERRLGPAGSTRLAGALSDYGMVLHDRRDLAGAEAAYAEALALRRRLLGAHHVVVVSSLTNLGYVLSDLGRTEEALARHAEALDVSRALFPEPHPDLATSISGYATALRRAGRPREALARFQECVAVWRAVEPSARTPKYANDLAQLGAQWLDLEQPERAEAALRDAVAEFARLEPSASLNAQAARVRLGLALRRLGRNAEAAAELEPGLAALAPSPYGWGFRQFHLWKLEHAGTLLALDRGGAAAAILAEVRAHLAARPEEAWPEGEALLTRLEADLVSAL